VLKDAVHAAARTDSVRVVGRLRRRLHRTLVQRIGRRIPIAGDFDIYHSYWGELPPAGFVRAKARILTVYDLIPVLAPDAFPDAFVSGFTRKIRSVDVHRDWVAAISESTRRDFCAFTKMDPARVFLMPLAAAPEIFHPVTAPSELARVRGAYGIRTPRYVLSLSTVHARKGSLTLARCFGRLVRSGRLPDASLVLAGAQLETFKDIFAATGLGHDLAHRVVVPGYVPNADLAALCSGARLDVYLSRYEGFGLPPLEAMQCGVPVVASNTSSMPEVVGDAGLLVDPDDEDAIAGAIARLWNDDDLHRTLGARGVARARTFAWQQSMDVLLGAYRTMLEHA
jgi:glycosyltransferase involved in cell wall biosynthesis